MLIYNNKNNDKCFILYEQYNNISNILGISGYEESASMLDKFLITFIEEQKNIICYPGLVSSDLISFLLKNSCVFDKYNSKIFYNYSEVSNLNLLSQIIKQTDNKNILNNFNRIDKRLSFSVSVSSDIIKPFYWYSPDNSGYLKKYDNSLDALTNSSLTGRYKYAPLFLPEEDVYKYRIFFYETGNYSLEISLK